jgi:hypothetical protein
VIAELTAAVTSIPDDEDPVAAWRIELRSIEVDDDEESRELSAETELIAVPIPLGLICAYLVVLIPGFKVQYTIGTLN